MFIVDLLGWWYSHGWSWAGKHLFIIRSRQIAQFFSISDMLKTLFAPFRQDAINTSGAPVGVKLQALGGNLISRCFGLLLRTALIGTGLLALCLNFVLAVFAITIWPLLPLSPAVAVILVATGVGHV